MRSWSKLSLVLAGVIAVSLFSPPAEACSRIAQSGIRGFQILPLEGSRVPRSTSLWVRSDEPIHEAKEAVRDPSSVRLLDERGKAVAMTATSVRVTGEQVATLFVLKPMTLLEANASYKVELNGVVLTRFTTSAEIDTEPPSLPRAKFSEVKGEQSSAGVACGAPSQVTVQLESPADVNFLVLGAASGTTMPGSALAVTNGPDLTAVAVPEGSHDFRVVAFDLSGNLAMSSEKLSTFVPADGVGCSSTLAAPGLAVLALLGVLRRARRR